MTDPGPADEDVTWLVVADTLPAAVSVRPNPEVTLEALHAARLLAWPHGERFVLAATGELTARLELMVGLADALGGTVTTLFVAGEHFTTLEAVRDGQSLTAHGWAREDFGEQPVGDPVVLAELVGLDPGGLEVLAAVLADPAPGPGRIGDALGLPEPLVTHLGSGAPLESLPGAQDVTVVVQERPVEPPATPPASDGAADAGGAVTTGAVERRSSRAAPVLVLVLVVALVAAIVWVLR